MKIIFFAFITFCGINVFGQSYDPVYGKKDFKDSIRTKYINNGDSVLSTNASGTMVMVLKGGGAYVPLSGTAAGSPVTGNLVVNADIILNGATLKYDAALFGTYFGYDPGYNNTGLNLNANGRNVAANNTGNNVNANGDGAGQNNTFNNVDLSGAYAQADANKQQVFNNGTANTRWDYNLITAHRKLVIQNKSGTVAMTSDLPDSQYLRRDININASNIALKQNLVTLTTTGTSGASTFNQSTGALNIPSYSGGGGSSSVWDSLNFSYYARLNVRSLDQKMDSVNRGLKTYNILLLGDSRVEQDQIMVNNFKENLSEKYSIAGQGMVMGASFTGSTTAAIPASPTAANWTVKSRLTGGRGLSLYSYVSSGVSTDFGLLANRSFQYSRFSNADISWWGQAGGGTFTVLVDGILKATINTASATGAQKTTITGLTDSIHQFTIHPVSSNAEFLGANLYNSISGLRIHKVGASGAKTSDYLAADSTSWSTQLSWLSPDIAFIYLGTNEVAGGISSTVFKPNAKQLINRIKKVNPLIDIVFIGQCEFDSITWGSSRGRVDSMNKVMKEIAIEDTIAVFNPDKLYGTYAQSNARGDWSDGIHQTAAGGFHLVTPLINSIPAFQKVNIKELYRKAYGDSVVVATQLPNLFVVTNANGNLVANPNYADGANTFTLNNKRLVSNNEAFFNTGITGGTSPYSAGNLRVGISSGSAVGNIGYFGFSQGANLLNSGYTQGIRVDAASSSVRFQNTNQGGVVDNWVFENFAAVARDFSQTSSYIHIKQSWGNTGAANASANWLDIDGDINKTSTTTGNIVRGFWYHPTVTSLTGTGAEHVFIEQTIGNNKFNTTSGTFAIGSATTATEKLEVTGNIKSSATVITGGYTVATLPTGVIGMTAYVTDATAPTYLGTLTGGGAVKCPVFYNGTAWVAH